MINSPLNSKDRWEDWSYNESESEQEIENSKEAVELALRVKCIIISSIQQSWMMPIAKN